MYRRMDTGLVVNPVKPLWQFILLLSAMMVTLLLAGGMVLAADMVGTGGDDSLMGTEGDDRIAAGGGNDTVSGLGGTDQITGDLGNDKLVGGVGSDRLNGGAGDDNITASDSPNTRDVVSCGAGYDVVLADSLDEVSADCEDTTTTLTTDEEAQVDGPPPPGAYDDVYTAQGLAGTNCRERVDDPHRSASATPRYSEALTVVGVRYCSEDKARIWIDARLQRWVPYPGYWKTVRRIDDNDYDTRENLKILAYKCPTTMAYWYRAGLYDATMVDKDGTRHEMLFSRWSNERFFKCDA